MAKKTTYQDVLRAEMRDIISQLDLSPLYKQTLERRWLDQVLWMDKKADQCRRWHYRMRLTTIIGGVVLPALVSISLNEDQMSANVRKWTALTAFGLSQVVAISAAIEEFCRYGDRWRQYRETVETMKTEGWQYLQSSGPYQKTKSHAEGYPIFATRIEDIIQKDVKVYITEVAKERKDEGERERLEKYSPEAVASSMMSAWAAPPPPPPLPPEAAPVADPNAVPMGAPAYAGAAPVTQGIPTFPVNGVQPAYAGAPMNGAVAYAVPPAAPVAPVAAPVAPAAPVASAPIPGANWAAAAGIQMKVLSDAVFKLSTRPAEQLAENEKVLVKGGSVYTLHSHGSAENQHVKVALSEVGLGPDHRNTWYVPASQIEIEGTEPDNQPDDKDDPPPQPQGHAIRLPGLSAPVYLNMPIVPNGHFTWAEATKNGTRIPADDDIVEGIIRVAKVLEEVRAKLGNRSMKINSWYRDPASNRRAGGASKSRHMVGDAVDFVVDGINPFEVYRQLEPWWGSRGGLASSSRFTHIDVRGYKARWKYPN